MADAALVGAPGGTDNEHADYPRGAPWPLIWDRREDIMPPAISSMVPPAEAGNAGRLRPGVLRRADWLSAVPPGCWTTYGLTMQFAGYDS